MSNTVEKLQSLMLLLAAVVCVFCGWHLVASFLLVGFAIFSYKLSHTAHGKLHYLAALSLNFATFGIRYKPDATIDFHLPLPINLLFPLSSLLPNESVAKTEDIKVAAGDGEIPARVYWPKKTIDCDGELPIIVYFHGGGFVVGSIADFDDLTRSLANATHAIVVSVGYRLAPRHPYPAAIEDGCAAVKWVADHAELFGADPKKLVIAGDSAGATISAVVASHAAKNKGPHIAGQILYYPHTDLRGTPYDSFVKFSDGYGLSRDVIDGFHEAYLGNVEDLSHPYVSPLLTDNYSHLPPALIVTAGFDPLHNSGELYAKTLAQHNVPVTYLDYKDMIHGFISIRFFPQRRDVFVQTGKYVERLFQHH
ncbi:MAG: alpha/beta hydrolase [Pseudomonadales bacterium]|nr:alpha/beta hydrolase [Pseudomonadales bacterium]